MTPYLTFIDAGTNLQDMYATNYDPLLVLASIAVAIFSSYAAFRVAERISGTRILYIKLAWITAGSLVLGGGVWAMHFIGMLALNLPCGISYDPLVTVLSMGPGILGAAVALTLIGQKQISLTQLFVGGVMMGLGVGTMHYAGMAALRMDAFMRYDPNIFSLSILIAIILATLSIGIKFAIQRSGKRPSHISEAVQATVMGLSVSGMHYTGMLAVNFFPGDELSGSGITLHPMAMGIAISLVMIVLVFMTLAAAFFGRYLDTFANLREEIQIRRKAETQIRKLSQAVEQSPTTIMITGTDGLIEYVNPRFYEVTGYSVEEIIGANPRILKSGKMQKPEYGELWNTIKSGGTWRGEMLNKKKDGTLYWDLTSISPIRNSDGEITNFIAIKEDVTERKDTEKSLLRSKEEAEYANSAKSHFLASMSHELRTPLNAIIGFADMLLMEVKGPLGDPSYKEYVGDIKNSGVHLSKILVDILDVSKIETGNVDLDEEYVAIPNITSSCMRIIRPRAEEKGITINENIPEGLPRLYVDAVKLKQILINLLTNAIKYTQNGGTVELTVITGKDGKIAFHIIDNGIGMAAKDIPRALEPFGQLADVLTRDQEGVGLGLHLTKALVELHDGRLGIDSTLGEGTTVSVIFPAERTDSPPRTS